MSASLEESLLTNINLDIQPVHRQRHTPQIRVRGEEVDSNDDQRERDDCQQEHGSEDEFATPADAELPEHCRRN